MAAEIDVYQAKPKRILMIASNPTISKTTGYPIGFWWAELVHPYWELTEAGYEIDIVSPDGGKLEGDNWSDPRDPSGYSAHDILSLGFINSLNHAKLLENTKSLSEVNPKEYAGIFLVGGQGPMYTFYNDERLHRFVADFYETGKVTCIICHATCTLLKIRLSNGELLVKGKTWTGFAASEEAYGDSFAGFQLQPFRIEDEAKKIPDTNYINRGRFRSFAVRDGNLVTGQQQYSGAEAARLVIAALGQ